MTNRSIIVIIGFLALASLIWSNSALYTVVRGDSTPHPSQLGSGSSGSSGSSSSGSSDNSNHNKGGNNGGSNSPPPQENNNNQPQNNQPTKDNNQKHCKSGKQFDSSLNKCVKDTTTSQPTNSSKTNATVGPLGIGTSPILPPGNSSTGSPPITTTVTNPDGSVTKTSTDSAGNVYTDTTYTDGSRISIWNYVNAPKPDIDKWNSNGRLTKTDYNSNICYKDRASTHGLKDSNGNPVPLCDQDVIKATDDANKVNLNILNTDHSYSNIHTQCRTEPQLDPMSSFNDIYCHTDYTPVSSPQQPPTTTQQPIPTQQQPTLPTLPTIPVKQPPTPTKEPPKICEQPSGGTSVIQPQQVSDNFMNFIEAKEGYNTKPGATGIQHVTLDQYGLYNDIAGHCTSGFGHTVHRPQLVNDRCTPKDIQNYQYGPGGQSKEQAEVDLQKDLAVAVKAVKDNLKDTQLTQDQFDALVDLAFNEGPKAVNPSSSTLARDIKAGNCDADTIKTDFGMWNKVKDPKTGKLVPNPGLTTRRGQEANIFSNGVYPQ